MEIHSTLTPLYINTCATSMPPTNGSSFLMTQSPSAETGTTTSMPLTFMATATNTPTMVMDMYDSATTMLGTSLILPPPKPTSLILPTPSSVVMATVLSSLRTRQLNLRFPTMLGMIDMSSRLLLASVCSSFLGSHGAHRRMSGMPTRRSRSLS